LKNTYENKDSDINSLIKLLGIQPAKQGEKKEISIDTELILNSIRQLDQRITTAEYRSIGNKPVRLGSGLGNGNVKDFSTGFVGQVIKPDEAIKLKRGDWIYHESLGHGQVVGYLETVNQGKKELQLQTEFGKAPYAFAIPLTIPLRHYTLAD
jgi:hypothetical protein